MAHVASGAGLARCPRARGEFGTIGVPAGLIDEAARHAEGALFDRLADEARLRLELLPLQPPVVGARDAGPGRAEAHERGHVGRHTATFHRAEELIEGRPVHVDPVVMSVALLREARRPVQRRSRRAAVPADLGRDALGDFSQHPAVGEPQLVGVGMDVDEARRERESGAIDDLVRIAVRTVADE